MNFETFKEYMPEIRRLLMEKISVAQSPVEIFGAFANLSHILEQAKNLRAQDEVMSA